MLELIVAFILHPQRVVLSLAVERTGYGTAKFRRPANVGAMYSIHHLPSFHLPTFAAH